MYTRQFFSSFFILALTICLLDLYLNLTKTTPPILKYYNETFGALNVPNIKYLKSKEGFFIGSTNYDGRFRETYPKRKIQKNSFRIILVGDSFVEGIDVLSRNHFANYMEQILEKKLMCKVEVLNFGRGNCTLQPSSYYYLNYIKKEYDADIVLFFTEARDVEEASNFPSTSFIYNNSKKRLEESKIWEQSKDYQITKALNDFGLLAPFSRSGWFRLAYRSKSGIEMYGFFSKIFGKFYGEVKLQTYQRTPITKEVSKTSAMIFDSLSKEVFPPITFVIRNFPLESENLEKYMDSMKYRFISLKDTLDFKTIRNTSDDAYYFKTTNLYGGHWNHLGHKAVGYFLSNRIVNEIQSGKLKQKKFKSHAN